jgi:hypothetical protein
LFQSYAGRASRPALEARLRELEPGLAPEWIDGGVDALALGVRERDLVPLAAAIASRNAALPTLTLHAERPAAALGDALADVKSSTGFDLARARFRAGFGRGHLLEVVIHCAEFSSNLDEAALGAAERLTRLLLGDQRRAQWVGSVAVATMPRGILPVVGSDDGAKTLPIAELVPSVDAAIAGLYAGFPDAPLARIDSSDDWVMFEIEPEDTDDPTCKDDLVLASTCMPELTKAFVEGMPFSSARFSRHGELFCYVKARSADRSAADQHAALTTLEDALSEALRERALGAVVGSGLGVRYSYVDVALHSVEAAMDVLCRVAVDQRLSRDSWLLFCDSEWESEWLPLVPNGRPPPGMEAL